MKKNITQDDKRKSRPEEKVEKDKEVENSY